MARHARPKEEAEMAGWLKWLSKLKSDDDTLPQPAEKKPCIICGVYEERGIYPPEHECVQPGFADFSITVIDE